MDWEETRMKRVTQSKMTQDWTIWHKEAGKRTWGKSTFIGPMYMGVGLWVLIEKHLYNLTQVAPPSTCLNLELLQVAPPALF